MSVKAPFYTRENLRRMADEFLDAQHPTREIPVPIEHIVEYGFGIDIVPMPGLHRHFDVDAFITSDLSEIRVDQAVYESRENRYRFSLAHELAHGILHREVFSQLRFSTIQQWKDSRSLIPEREYGLIEWHANEFAGLVLVPPSRLEEVFLEAKANLATIGLSLDDGSAAVWDYLESWIARRFAVSSQVIAKRGPADGHWRA